MIEKRTHRTFTLARCEYPARSVEVDITQAPGGAIEAITLRRAQGGTELRISYAEAGLLAVALERITSEPGLRWDPITGGPLFDPARARRAQLRAAHEDGGHWNYEADEPAKIPGCPACAAIEADRIATLRQAGE